MADENNKSLSMSRLVFTKLKAYVDARKENGDDSIPSVSNLLNRLGIAYLRTVTNDPELDKIEDAINEAARRVSSKS
jgi:hypothetical protein